MNQEPIHYLQAYIGQLDGVRDEDDVYRALSDWHFATRNALVQAMHGLNAELGLQGAYRLQAHMATTAIGRLSGEIVVISANPGYSAKKNPLEDAHRSRHPDANRNLCRQFFARYQCVCRGRSPYWTAVMRFLEFYWNDGVKEAPVHRWARAARQDELGGIDLLPFHSNGDNITRHLHGVHVQPLLREVAQATLAMALRLAPRFLLVASPAGHELISDLLGPGREAGPLAQIPIVPAPLPPELAARRPYSLVKAWNANVNPARTTTIVSLPYQIFSGSLIHSQIGYSHADYAELLRALNH